MPTLNNAIHAATHPVQWLRNRNVRHTPKNLFIFFTDTCNLHCEHCFYHFELNKKAVEISLEQMDKIMRSLTRPTFVCLTGGEVTLRKDLNDAALLIADSGKADYINVCTNGFYPERIESLVEATIASGRLQRIGFQISLDGMKEMHNTVRGHDKAYQRAIESLKLLKKLQDRFPGRLDYSALAVITRHTFDQCVDLLHDTQKDGIPLGFSIVRGSGDVFKLPLVAASAFDVKDHEATLGVSNAEWRRKIEEIYEVKRAYGYAYPNDTDWRKFNVILDTLDNQRRMIPCDAGSDDGVVYPNGNVAHCENTKPFGNLADFDYDLQAAWYSDAAEAMRKRITACACTHACNIVNSLVARPELYPVPAPAQETHG